MNGAAASRVRDPAVVREVEDEAKTKGLEATFHVAVPPDALFAILWDPGNFARLYPDILEHKVLGTDKETADIQYRVNAIVKEVKYVLRRTRNAPQRTILWRELSGDLKRVRGAWRLEATDDPGVSRVRYEAFVDIGRFVPTALVRDGAMRKIGEMVERLRRVGGEIHARAGRA